MADDKQKWEKVEQNLWAEKKWENKGREWAASGSERRDDGRMKWRWIIKERLIRLAEGERRKAGDWFWLADSLRWAIPGYKLKLSAEGALSALLIHLHHSSATGRWHYGCSHAMVGINVKVHKMPVKIKIKGHLFFYFICQTVKYENKQLSIERLAWSQLNNFMYDLLPWRKRFTQILNVNLPKCQNYPQNEK